MVICQPNFQGVYYLEWFSISCSQVIVKLWQFVPIQGKVIEKTQIISSSVSFPFLLSQLIIVKYKCLTSIMLKHKFDLIEETQLKMNLFETKYRFCQEDCFGNFVRSRV